MLAYCRAPKYHEPMSLPERYLRSDLIENAIREGRLPPDIIFRAAFSEDSQDWSEHDINDAIGAAYGLHGYKMPEWATQADSEWPDCGLLRVYQPHEIVARSGVDYYTRTDLRAALFGNRDLYELSHRHPNHPVSLSRAVWRRLIGHFSLSISEAVLRAETVYMPGQRSSKKDTANWYIDHTIIRDGPLYELFVQHPATLKDIMHGIGTKAVWMVGGMLAVDNHADLLPWAEKLENFAYEQYDVS